MNIGAILSTPAVDGDTVYFGSWDGNLYAIG
jgi:outer membrane protein assembly factor BamB